MALKGFHRVMPGQGWQKPYYDVQGCTVHAPLQCIILADQLLEGEGHFLADQRRPVPCIGKPDCPHCGKKGKRRKAFAAAITARTKYPFVLELTNHAIDQLAKLTVGRQSIRGLHLKLQRQRKKDGSPNKQGAVCVEILAEIDPASLPPTFDEVPSVEKMYGVADDTGEAVA